MTIPLSTISYDQYTGDGSLSVYPITFPTYETSTVKVFVSTRAEWDRIQTIAPITEIVLSTDYVINNIGKPSTSVTLLDASDVPVDWVGPIPARQIWLDASGFLKTGYFLFIEFISNPMRPAVLSHGNQLVPALSKDLDRLTMHVKALDHKLLKSFSYLNLLATGGQVGDLLPTDGVVGDYLEHDGTEAIWQTGVFSGFSARYNTALDLPDLRAALLYIFNFSYISPTISLSCSPSQTVREKGSTVAAVTMNATTVKKALDITAVTHFRNSVLVETEAAPQAGGGLESYVDSTPFSDTMTFFSKVFDGTTLVQSNTVTYSYAYPYYEGVGAAALDSTGIVTNLTKVVRASTANVAVTSSPVGQKIYFCYPAAYADLTSILDPSSFEVLSAFTKRLVNITGLDGTSQSYKVYELNALTTQTGYKITFKR